MVRIGIVGLGFMGMIHYLAARKLRGAKVTAICSRDPKKLAGDWRGIRGNFGPPGEQMDLGKIKKYQRLDDLLADPDLAKRHRHWHRVAVGKAQARLVEPGKRAWRADLLQVTVVRGLALWAPLRALQVAHSLGELVPIPVDDLDFTEVRHDSISRCPAGSDPPGPSQWTAPFISERSMARDAPRPDGCCL
jgi:hypothetical protein